MQQGGRHTAMRTKCGKPVSPRPGRGEGIFRCLNFALDHPQLNLKNPHRRPQLAIRGMSFLRAPEGVAQKVKIQIF